MIRAIAITVALICVREQYAGQYDGVDPKKREWFRSQKIPGTTQSCCNEADGADAEEDIINGKYWTRWRIGNNLTAWQPVPDAAVIEHGNRWGTPVVWFWFDNGVAKIRCYAPGAKS